MANIRVETDAYNSVGEHLKNDEEQSRLTLAAAVLAAILFAAIILIVVMS